MDKMLDLLEIFIVIVINIYSYALLKTYVQITVWKYDGNERTIKK